MQYHVMLLEYYLKSKKVKHLKQQIKQMDVKIRNYRIMFVLLIVLNIFTWILK